MGTDGPLSKAWNMWSVESVPSFYFMSFAVSFPILNKYFISDFINNLFFPLKENPPDQIGLNLI